MPIGDGANWDETNPTNSTLAISIDEYDRDLRIGVRSRMMAEHEWPSSQSATNQAGQHKFITMQNQATKPTVSGTQLAAIYTKTQGSGLQELYWENEAGTEVQITNRGIINGACVGFNAASTSGVITTTTIPYDTSIPDTGEGTLIKSVSYAAKSTSNKLKITGHAGYASTEAVHSIWALFQATTAEAIAAGEGSYSPANGGGEMTPFTVITPATTASVTYYFRAGSNVGVLKINSDSAGNAVLGAANSAYIAVEEYQP